MVKRLENWPMLLSSFLDEKLNEPFQWGKNDCLTFLAKAAETMTGVDYYKEYAGYSTEEEANKILEANGGIIKIIESYLGSGTRNALQGRRGDVALVKRPELCAGVIDDSGRYIALISKEGLIRVPLEKAWRVWRF